MQMSCQSEHQLSTMVSSRVKCDACFAKASETCRLHLSSDQQWVNFVEKATSKKHTKRHIRLCSGHFHHSAFASSFILSWKKTTSQFHPIKETASALNPQQCDLQEGESFSFRAKSVISPVTVRSTIYFLYD